MNEFSVFVAIVLVAPFITGIQAAGPAATGSGIPYAGAAPVNQHTTFGAVPRDRASYSLPLAGAAIADVVRRFEPPATTYSRGHRGVDIAADEGRTVFAPRSGTVTFAGQVAGRGVLVISHPDGLRSTLEAVSTALSRGDAVESGQAVGKVAAGHDCRGLAACLHWGVRTSAGDYIDPISLIRGGKIVLLPRNEE
ncbi:M23 family metallopeptidase [Rarobacter incanus]|nr:M23 family metallopeptidase [Rarobacter incanus]